MGRRDRDDLPPVEVWGEPAPAATDLQRVEVGPRRPRRLPAVLAALVLAALGAGILLGGDDEDPLTSQEREERDNRLRNDLKPQPSISTSRTPRSTTSTTTTTLPLGPVFGEETDAALVIMRGSTGTWLDLDTGERRDVLLGRAVDGFGAIGVRGGLVVRRLGRIEYVPLPDGEPRELLPGAVAAVSSGSPDSVWLMTELLPMERPRRVATLVDLAGRTLLGPIDASTGWVPWGTEDGVLSQHAGRTYLTGEDGPRVVAVGDLMGATRDAVLVYVCDEQLTCGLELIDAATLERTSLGPVGDPYEYGIVAVVAPDAHAVAVAQIAPNARTLSMVGDGLEASWELSGAGLQGDRALAWLPGDLGFVGLDGRTGVTRYYVDDHGVPSREPAAALGNQFGDALFVIPR